MDGADGRQVRACELLAQLLADLRRPPARIFPFEADDRRLDRGWQPIGLAIGSSAPIRERLYPTVFVPVVDFVAGLARDAKLRTQARHLLALEQAGNKPEPLVHDVTLLPRHAPSCKGAKVSPMCPEYCVTYLSGSTKNRKIPNRKIQIPSQSLKRIARRRLAGAHLASAACVAAFSTLE